MENKGNSGSRGNRGGRGNKGLFICFLCFFCFLCFARFARAQAPATTTVQDTVYKPDGTLASGSVVISWSPFLTADSKPVFGGTKTVTLTNGSLAVALTPNSGGTPSGTSYGVKFLQSGGVFFEETWVVPASSPLANPAQPVSVTQAGTPGSTTYYYWCTATNASGETLLSPSRITTTSHATLDGTNYNIITCATVSGATGYKAYRTTTSTAPSGTGLYLAGSSATTTINDQSNTLTSETIPTLNTTDPKTLAQVRVTAAPTPTVIFNATQVTGTAIVSTPSATQTITAPATAGLIPLQLKGNTTANANVLEIFDSQATPVRQSYFDSGGKLNTAQLITSTLATGTAPFSVASTTLVTNLNADTLDGIQGSSLVQTTRLISTTSPITGGGDLSADRTIACATCTTNAAALTANELMIGGGGQAAQALGSPGTTTTVLHGNAAGAPTYSAVSLTADVTGILPLANGVTGSATQNFVDLTTNQSVGGVKTFSQEVVSSQFLSGALVSVTFSTTPDFDAGLGNLLKLTLTGNVTSSTISNPTSGEQILLLLCQDATGSRTMAWPSNLKLAGGSYTLTTTASKCDTLTAAYDGSNWYEMARATNE